MNAHNKPVIVITGASSGIGLYTLLGAISAGYFAIGACRDPESCMQMLLDQYNLNSDDFSLIHLDLTEHESVITFAKSVKSISKSVHSVVLNAGVIKTDPCLMTTLEDLRFHSKVNFEHQIILAQSFIKSFFLRQKGGSIVAVSSSAAIDANQGRLAYAASKAALATGIRVMSKELGKANIRLNVVAPGLTDTKLMHQSTENDQIKQVIEMTSLKKMGQPLEVANSVLFLISDSSSHITGQVLSVDGGIR
jgi:3-oxoacyl-[acyl-carrier protein] reductase